MAQTLVLAYDKIMLNSEAPLQYFISFSPLKETRLFDEVDPNEGLAERPLEILRRVLTSLRDNAAHREIVEKYQLHEGQETSSPPVADLKAKWNFAYAMVKWALGHKQVLHPFPHW
ncbi:hypothetical protein DSO57_1034428 [Entomophthora muscae]|uniref:Uncharacterized protein n=1 Tax=Entomophthora muscae TaxID=34485 RepID=A0ACC2UL65_9FUNG|nr:hypothetical protein DSO57_1034428 [Entomophthora muscae]